MNVAVRAVLGGALAVVVASDAIAQQAMAPDAGRRFTVTPLLGTIVYDWSSGLSTRRPGDDGVWDDKVVNPTLGVAANYAVMPQVGVGFYFEASRPTTRGDYFPALLLKFGDDVQLRTVSQRVTVLMYGLQGQFGMNFGRLAPYVGGGIGAVTVNLDPQQNDDNVTFSNSSGQIGGGLGFQIGRGTLTIDARDFLIFGWDRDRLNPVKEFVGTSTGYRNTTFPTANAAPPEKKKTIHNGRVAIGFSFVPQLRTAENQGDDDDQE
jgi:opacity protein-like surface antigen